MLYLLVLTDPELSYDNYSEDFYIGLFDTEQQAEDIAKHYLKNIKGFCDFPCTYRIVKKDVIGDFNSRISDYLWTVHGWNTNEYLDEIDIIESPCFLTEEQADAELPVMKKKYQREEWTVTRWKIGALEWREGFVQKNGSPSFKLTFEEIQEIAGIPIDHSFLNYKKELTDYGYQVGKISMKEQTVIFNRMD